MPKEQVKSIHLARSPGQFQGSRWESPPHSSPKLLQIYTLTHYPNLFCPPPMPETTPAIFSFYSTKKVFMQMLFNLTFENFLLNCFEIQCGP